MAKRNTSEHPRIGRMRHTLWEVTDVLERIYTVASVEDLRPTSRTAVAASLEYAAESG